MVAKQLGLDLHQLGNKLPLYDGVTGEMVDELTDARVERARDTLMDRARLRVDREGLEATAGVSLAEVIEDELEQQFGDKVDEEDKDKDDDDDDDKDRDAAAAGGDGGDKDVRLSARERRLLGWHWANLEYGCSAPLSKVSMANWNQDEAYGGFGGSHCMVKGGYGAITAAMTEGLDVRLDTPVSSVKYTAGDGDKGGVVVTTAAGEAIEGAACIVTVPLGCLKKGDIVFDPPLSDAKTGAIDRLGFGHLNKVVMEFNSAFWDTSVDYFGAAREDGEATEGKKNDGGEDDGKEEPRGRGRMFMFWNLEQAVGAPVLTALVAGAAAEAAEEEPEESLVASAMGVLRRISAAAKDKSAKDVAAAAASADDDAIDAAAAAAASNWVTSEVTDPIATTVSRWGTDPHSRGSYSYVAVGSSGEDYDEIGRPEASSGGRLMFAGEHTCKEHPDTVGGAMLTGWRAARHALHLMAGEPGEPFDEVFKLLTLEDLAAGDSDDDSDSDSDSDGGSYVSEEGEGDGGGKKKSKKKKKNKKEKKKSKGDKAAAKASKKRRGRRIDSDDDEEGGPEDDEAARERARKKLEEEAQAKLEQLRREAKEATEGKEEVKKVLRVMAEVEPVNKEKPKPVATEVMNAFVGLMVSLDTVSGRRAFVEAALEKVPGQQRAEWALRRDGLAGLTTWLEQVSLKERGVELTCKMIRLLLVIPAELRSLRSSGVAKIMQTRFATHPKAEVRMLARRCAHRWTQAVAAQTAAKSAAKAAKAKAAAGGDEGDDDDDDDDGDDDDAEGEKKKKAKKTSEGEGEGEGEEDEEEGEGKEGGGRKKRKKGSDDGDGDVDDDDDVPLRRKKANSSRDGDGNTAAAAAPKREVTVDEMIASAADLPEGVAAAEAQRMAQDADAALKAAQDAVLEAEARAKEAEAMAAVQLKDAWAMPEPGVSGGKKQKLRMKNFDDFAAHKTRKREHKKREQARREREEAEDARLEAEEEAAAAAVGGGGGGGGEAPAPAGAAGAAPMDTDNNAGAGAAPEVAATLAAATAALNFALTATPEEAHKGGFGEKLKALGAMQLGLLKHAMTFPSAGVVVYSTCSVHPVEDELVVAAALADPAVRAAGWRLAPALPSWPCRGLPLVEGHEMLVRAGPEVQANGFFVARFERTLKPPAAGGGGAGGGGAGGGGGGKPAANKGKRPRQT